MNWITEKLMGLVTGPMVGRLVRHGLTTLAGVLAAASFPGLAEIGELLMANMDNLVQALTVSLLGLIALIMSVKSDKK